MQCIARFVYNFYYSVKQWLTLVKIIHLYLNLLEYRCNSLLISEFSNLSRTSKLLIIRICLEDSLQLSGYNSCWALIFDKKISKSCRFCLPCPPLHFRPSFEFGQDSPLLPDVTIWPKNKGIRSIKLGITSLLHKPWFFG